MPHPPRAVRWLVGDAPARVLELGAGTGSTTALLRSAGHEVVATDADDPADVPAGAHQVRTGAEGLPFASRSFDVVLVAGPLARAGAHRELGRRLPELARVLRPGGTLAVARDELDHTIPWVRRLLGTSGDREEPAADPSSRPWLGSDLFADHRSAAFGHWQDGGVDDLVELLRPRTALDRETLRRRAREVHAAQGSGAGTLRLRYRTACDRARVVPRRQDEDDEADDGSLLVDLG